MMKLLLIAGLSFGVGCSHQFHTTKTQDHSDAERGIASAGFSPIQKFLTAAIKAEDNVAYKSANEMQAKLLQEVKANPARFGITDDVNVSKIKSLYEIDNQRVVAEILSEAPQILRFTPKMTNLSTKAVMNDVGIYSWIKVGVSSADYRKIKLAASEQTPLGRKVSLKLKNLKTSLVERKIASASQADAIYKNLFKASQDFGRMAAGNPKLLALGRQIIDYSATISERTGKHFLGSGSCKNLSGIEVFTAKADIAFKTATDVESKGLRSYDELSSSLQKNHSEVTERTLKQSCTTVKALTSGDLPCGTIYAKGLKPKNC